MDVLTVLKQNSRPVHTIAANRSVADAEEGKTVLQVARANGICQIVFRPCKVTH
jgi:hypothetical protein